MCPLGEYLEKQTKITSPSPWGKTPGVSSLRGWGREILRKILCFGVSNTSIFHWLNDYPSPEGWWGNRSAEYPMRPLILEKRQERDGRVEGRSDWDCLGFHCIHGKAKRMFHGWVDTTLRWLAFFHFTYVSTRSPIYHVKASQSQRLLESKGGRETQSLKSRAL